jgi:hypothetical protein
VNVKLRKLALAIRYQWSSASAAALVIPAESDNSRTGCNTTTEKSSGTDSTGDGCNRTRASIFHAPEHFISSGAERKKLQNLLN